MVSSTDVKRRLTWGKAAVMLGLTVAGIAAMMVFARSSSAANLTTSITVNGGATASTCAAGEIYLGFQMNGSVDDNPDNGGTIEDYVTTQVLDGNGVQLSAITYQYTGTSIQSPTIPLAGITARPVTVNLIDVGPAGGTSGTLIGTVTVDPASLTGTSLETPCSSLPVGPVTSSSASSSPSTCPSGSINCGGAGDEYVQVLNRSDSNGNPAMQFWCISEGGIGYLGGVITQADLQNVPATPSTHTLVKTIDCRVPVTFWVLTTGEYQINIGPNAKGNTVVMIFKGIPPTDMKAIRLDNDH